MRPEYLTVKKETTCETVEKKSRFIATVKPVSTEEEARLFIDEIKAKYWDATHNVYAYYICGDTTLQKYSDDGEPAGTAGLPVLEAIKKHGVQDVAVVVTRYFGGILLGAAGLVRAYGKSASLGIEAAGIVRMKLCVETEIILDYASLGKVRAILAAKGYKVKDIIYAQDVEIHVYVPVGEFEKFYIEISEAAGANVIVQTGSKSYVAMEG